MGDAVAAGQAVRLGDPHAPRVDPPPPRAHEEDALLADQPDAEASALEHQPRLGDQLARLVADQVAEQPERDALRLGVTRRGARSALRSLPIGTTERAPRRA